MSPPLFRDLTQVNFLNTTHLQHYQFHIPPSGLSDPDFLAFFTIHALDGALLYVSETTIASKHAKFGPFSLKNSPKAVTAITISLWICCPGSQEYNVFLELHLDARNLKHISDSDSHKFSENAPVLRISDALFSLESYLRPQITVKRDPHDIREKLSYTVDDIRYLGNLIAGIRDFEVSKSSSSTQINSLKGSTDHRYHHNSVQEILHNTDSLIAFQAKQELMIESCDSEIISLKRKCKEIDSLVKEDFPLFKTLCTEQLEIVESQIPPIHETLEMSVFPELQKQIRSIVSVLEAAYPIDLLAASGRYCILGLEFPSSIQEILSMCYSNGPALTVQNNEELHESPIPVINSGLSHIISLMSMLASILNIRLKHETILSSSRHFIKDCTIPVSDEGTAVGKEDLCETQYPLYYDEEDTQKATCIPGSGEDGRNNARFEAGLKLLRSNFLQFSADITSLFAHYRGESSARTIVTVPLDCQDNFLWHLHFLLLYVTAS